MFGNTLWLLGGTVEVGEKEITLDDMWRLDLAKLDGWHLVQVSNPGDTDCNRSDTTAGTKCR